MAHQWRGVIAEYADRHPAGITETVVTLREGGTPLIPAEHLSELTGARVHVLHLSTADELALFNAGPLVDKAGTLGLEPKVVREALTMHVDELLHTRGVLRLVKAQINGMMPGVYFGLLLPLLAVALLVALEIKREALSGQLSSRDQLALPLLCWAALALGTGPDGWTLATGDQFDRRVEVQQADPAGHPPPAGRLLALVVDGRQTDRAVR